METPSLAKMFLSFLGLGMAAFGGPAMVVYIKELSVKHNKWLGEEPLKDGVGLYQSTPGATAMQMAAYVGLKTRGLPDAILSYIGFGLPAFSLMLIFSSLYLSFHSLRYVLSLFSGLQVIVIAIIVTAAHLFGGEVLKDYRDIFITITSAVLLFMGVSPFLVIAGTALTGIVVFRNIQRTEYRCTRTVGSFHVKQIVILLIILTTSLFVLYSMDKGLFKLAAVMMKINLFALGGGFASLPLMLHEFVNTRGGLDNKIFMDGIALGQVTPGSIISRPLSVSGCAGWWAQ
jgi:chromate transporter